MMLFPKDEQSSQDVGDLEQFLSGGIDRGYVVRDKSKPTAWKDYDDAALQKLIAPDTGMAYGTTTPQEALYTEKAVADAARDWYVPSTTWGGGMQLAGAAALSNVHPLAKMGALAAGFALSSTDAEAGKRDPRMWSPLSKQKLSKPLDELEHGFTDVRTPVPKIISPEDLVGGYGLFTPWDLSRANRTVTHIDNAKLDRPVRAHGGMGFPEANPGMAAASEQSISRRLDNAAAKLSETGKPTYIIPITMGPQGIDASHHVADPLSQLVQKAPIMKEDAAKFDEVMQAYILSKRGKKPSEAMVQDWVGIQDPRFQDYINNLRGGMSIKAKMADRMSLAEWQSKGFPNVAAVRHAMSEPGLWDYPTDTAGMTISRYEPGKGLLTADHPSYPKAVAGRHMGQLASLVPFNEFAPTIAEGLARANAANKAAGKDVAISPAFHFGKPTPGVPVYQEFDNQWLERMMKRLEAEKKGR